MKYAYYPGCTQEATAEEFGLSSVAVCRALGIELEEIPDWSCCGASSGHFEDDTLAHALSARNLALAEQQQLDTAVVCAACYLRLRATRRKVRQSDDYRRKIVDTIGADYAGSYDVKHLLDIIVHDYGLNALEKMVKKPLAGLRLVSYYGCYLVRPPKIVAFDDPENPTAMDRLAAALGATPCDWSSKVDCCGGSLILGKEELALGLIGGLLDNAREVQADAIVVACPMCHANLDMRQSGAAQLPVIYFTELIGLALGLGDVDAWLKKHLVDPRPLLRSHKLL
ncbi:MAG: heterodisulfide reductase subunit B [Deltaproteobacteria bacterium]|nr:heterodisulfide reductase subunit B [Deltaproteobacteria bacterium]